MKKLILMLLILVASISSFARQATASNTAVDTQNRGVKDGFWVPQNMNFTEDSRGINYISVVDENVVWAKAYDGATTTNNIAELAKTSDGGTTWAPIIMGSSVEGLVPAMVSAIDANTAWVPMWKDSGTNPQGIYKTTDGGTTWTRQETAAFNNATSFPNIVHFFNANDGFCQGDPADGYFEIYTTTDGGTIWTRVPEANIPDAPLSGEYGTVGFYDTYEDHIWFGTNKGRVYHSTDKGLNWTVGVTGLPNVTVTFTDDMNGLAQDKGTGSTGAIAETIDGGATWALVTPTGAEVFYSDINNVPGLHNVYVSTGAATDHSGGSYSFDNGHTWEAWADMAGTQMIANGWTGNTRGWAGGFCSGGNGGMFQFQGELQTGIANDMTLPSVVTLENNYPNPFNPSTTIKFSLKADAKVNLTIFDATGREVQNLVNAEMTKGSHTVNFDAADLTTGVYFYNINANGMTQTKKMILSK